MPHITIFFEQDLAFGQAPRKCALLACQRNNRPVVKLWLTKNLSLSIIMQIRILFKT